MNPYQMAQQIKHELQQVAWPSGSAEVVFGEQVGVVAIYAGAPTEDQFPVVFPCCLVVIGDGDPDEDHPAYITQTFRLITGVIVGGDPLGENAIIGGPAADLGKSANRGIAEVSARVRAAVSDLTGADGATMQVVGTSIDTPFLVGPLRHAVFDEHTVTALCTSDLHYAPPQQLEETGDTWTWEGGNLGGAGHCSGRFDFLNYVLRRKTGSAPTSPTDGTSVYTGTVATTTHTPIPGDTYGIFALYDARSEGTTDGNSDAEVVGTTVTISA